ncbi:MAG: DUF4037 domain-containing protein [Clostridia bacterium]|nr:DUF4037 domain-containing protein [Clostridia bacterium]
MKGIELCEKFYIEYGEPMMREHFGDLSELVAIGILGSGSECFGYDDEISRDHDFEPGFCIFLPSEELVDRKAEFALERAYSKLPRKFMGSERSVLQPAGAKRHGVIRISDFLLEKTGREDGELSLEEWFFVPEQSLAELTNGKIFFDRFGLMSQIRERLAYLPEDIRLKKLAGELLIMEQSGCYNYARCIQRGETAAAQLALSEFVKSSLHAMFLLSKRYMPYYKWSFRAFSELDGFSNLYCDLEYLISSSNSDEEYEKKSRLVAHICDSVISALCKQGLCEQMGDGLERYAYSVNQRITDHRIRNLNLLYGV